MNRNNLDALFITRQNNLYYLGFPFSNTTAGVFRPVFVVLPREGQPVAIVHAFGEPATRKTTWFEEIRTFSEPLGSSPQVGVETVVETFRDLGLTRGRIGSELMAPNGVG